MINFDDVTKENIKEHNPNWTQIPEHPYRILIIGGSGSGKTNSLFNLISHQSNIDKINLYAKGPYDVFVCRQGFFKLLLSCMWPDMHI